MSSKNIDKKVKRQDSIILGAHFSIAKGLHNALYEARSYQCNACQIFTKNANSWKERDVSSEEIGLFDKARSETGIKEIASHTSYLINLASPDKKKKAMSRNAMKKELIRSSLLNIPYVVLHPGSHMGSGTTKGIHQITLAVNRLFSEISDVRTRLLFETTAGQGTSIGHGFEQIASIMDKIENRDKVGVCLDTCHIFAAGYDIRTAQSYHETIDTFDATIGLEHLYVIHLNDSKRDFASKVDRHEQIGEGAIGIKGFECLMNDKRFINIPKIIETPKEKDGRQYDGINLSRLRGLVG